ncbi:AP2-like ethylene-responsive transcription factor BBM [Forsythia ovata]|uniref:AP2-like ethylene-responsive transcription factor BBM n=1 Tax=Forsythia ovata TaxID=205694 RepID=A0ABD1R1H3_9LAMI
MDSMNSWLGFSLSPQQVVLPSQTSQNLGLNSDEISAGTEEVSGECFHLTSDSIIPSLNLPAPFGILEAFNRNNQSQDWNLKDMSMNSFSCSSQNLENQERPRLENFLDGHSYNDQEHKKYQDSYIYQEPEANSHPTSNHSGTGMNDNGTIGLSMIKNWLRNNPAPPQPEENTAKNEAEPPPSTASEKTLSLSMSTGSQPDSPLPFFNGNVGESSTLDIKQHSGNALDSQTGAIDAMPRKSIDTFGQRTSIYRGVTRHRWTGRYEAHLWDNSCRREGQTRKGRQGGYDKEDKAARAYDLAALKYWGTTTTTNFPISNYEKELEEMKHMTRQEYVASLRRKSSGFSRGASIYRGVTRHHQHGRWQARIGRVAGNKDLYLGTFSTQEEAAEAYDIAAIKFRGLNAVTNFEISRYDVKSILESSTLPIGGAAKRLKVAENAEMALDIQRRANNGNHNSHLTDGLNGYDNGWSNTIAFHQPQTLSMHYPYGHPRYCYPVLRLVTCKK